MSSSRTQIPSFLFTLLMLPQNKTLAKMCLILNGCCICFSVVWFFSFFSLLCWGSNSWPCAYCTNALPLNYCSLCLLYGFYILHDIHARKENLWTAILRYFHVICKMHNFSYNRECPWVFSAFIKKMKIIWEHNSYFSYKLLFKITKKQNTCKNRPAKRKRNTHNLPKGNHCVLSFPDFSSMCYVYS